MIYFIPQEIFSYAADAQYPQETNFALSLLPNLALIIGWKTVVQFESTGAFDLTTFILFPWYCITIMLKLLQRRLAKPMENSKIRGIRSLS